MDSSFFDQIGRHGWAGEVAWLDALAASLVRDPAEAEDLAGDVWLQALERRPEVSEARPLRAWLTVVLRRLASRKRREKVARREREQRASRAENLPAADEAIERVELQRKLVEAVLDLDEPYRSAVVLRHLEQLSPSEIARRQKCTVEAARQRVARGLQQLRVRLDREFDGGRDAWRALLVPFATHSSVASTGAITGGVLVSTKLVGAALVIAAGLLLWMWPAQSRAKIESGALTSEASSQESPDETANSTTIESPRLVGLRDAAPASLAGPGLRGKVVDSSGAPQSGVSISFSSESGFSAPSAETNESGRFERLLDSEPSEGAAPIEAHAQSAEFCGSSTIICTGQEALIVLARLPRIEVRVVGPDGLAPTGSGLVQLEVRDTQDSLRSTKVELDDDGIARTDPMPLGQLVRVSAMFAGFATKSLTRSDELAGDATLHIEVTLSRGIAMRGVVLDEQTHRPLAGAFVRAQPNDPRDWEAAPSATTDGAGRFELRGVVATQHARGPRAADDFYYVSVVIDGFILPERRSLAWKHPAAMTTPAVVDNIELLVVPTGSLSVLLSWPDGHEIGNQFRVRVIDADGETFDLNPNADGAVEFLALPVGDLHVITMPNQDIAPRGLARAEFTLRAGERKHIALSLRSADAIVDGSVVDSQGRGLPGLSLFVISYLETSGMRSHLGFSDTETDAQGRFHVESLYPGVCKITVACDSKSMPLAFWPPVRKLELDEGSLVTGVDFHAESAVAYAGTLEPLSAIDASLPVFVELSHAEFGTITSDMLREDGRFIFPAMFGADYVLIAKQGTKELGRLAIPRTSNLNLIVPIAP